MKTIFVIFLIIAGIESASQNPVVNLKGSVGYSVAGNRTVLQSTSQQSAGIEIRWNYSRRVVGMTEFGALFMQNDNPYIDGQRAGYLGLGCGLRVLDSTDKFIVNVLPQLGGFTLVANDENPFGKKNSRWRQTGLKVEGIYQLRQRLAISLAYVRYFPVHFGDADFQSFIQFGLVLRLNGGKSSIED